MPQIKIDYNGTQYSLLAHTTKFTTPSICLNNNGQMLYTPLFSGNLNQSVLSGQYYFTLSPVIVNGMRAACAISDATPDNLIVYVKKEDDLTYHPQVTKTVVDRTDAYGHVLQSHTEVVTAAYYSGSRRVYCQFNKQSTRIGNVTRYRIWNQNNQVEQDRTDPYFGNWCLIYQTTDPNNDPSWHCAYYDVLLNGVWWKSNLLYPQANTTSSNIYIRE